MWLEESHTSHICCKRVISESQMSHKVTETYCFPCCYRSVQLIFTANCTQHEHKHTYATGTQAHVCNMSTKTRTQQEHTHLSRMMRSLTLICQGWQGSSLNLSVGWGEGVAVTSSKKCQSHRRTWSFRSLLSLSIEGEFESFKKSQETWLTSSTLLLSLATVI